MNPTANTWQCSACWKLHDKRAAADRCCTCIEPGCGAETNGPWLIKCQAHTGGPPTRTARPLEECPTCWPQP